MKADFILGVCFDNDDPNNLGRIRAIPIAEIGTRTSVRDIKNYIKAQDDAAVASSLYEPWYNTKLGVAKTKDKYLCEPFLPKHIAITPIPGQLVKIMKYEDNVSQEFIGPYTIDQVTLTEEYRNVIRNLQKNVNIADVLPKKHKTFISGYNNEQIIMGENEVLLRLAHINNDKTRKNTYPFIQLSQFNNSYQLVNKSVTKTFTTDLPVNYICQLFIDYVPKVNVNTEQNFTGTVVLFDTSKLINEQGKVGLTKLTMSDQKVYVERNSDNFLVRHSFSTTTLSDFTAILNKIIDTYKIDGSVAYYDKTNGATMQIIDDKIKNTTIVINNNVPNSPNSGGAVDTDNPDKINGGMRNWIYRLAPGTDIANYSGSFTAPNIKDRDSIPNINYGDYLQLDSFITANATPKNFGGLTTGTNSQVTSKQDVPQQTGIPQSVHTTYADKFLFLSSLTSPSLVDDMNNDGFAAAKIAEMLLGNNQNVKTYGLVRGEKLMELINDLLTLLLNHGHEAGVDPRASVIESTKQSILDLQKKVMDEKKQGQNNVLINHNFRIN